MTQPESTYGAAHPSPASEHPSEQKGSPARAAVGEQVSTLGHDVRELGRLTREAVREELANYRERGEHVLEGVRERRDELQGSLRNSVRENPVRSLAYAAGAGLLLGFCLRR